jgi:hypothetical protein
VYSYFETSIPLDTRLRVVAWWQVIQDFFFPFGMSVLLTPLFHPAAETFIFRNEMINSVVLAATSCFPSLLAWIDGSGQGFMGIVATIVGVLVVHYHMDVYHGLGQKPEAAKASVKLERGVLTLLVVCGLLYAHTSDVDWMFLFGFHWFALPVFVLGLIVFPVRFFWQRRISDVTLAIATVLHIASKDNPTRQLVLWIVVFQFTCLLLPLCESLRLMMAYPRDRWARHNLSMTSQAINLYVINQAFFAFYLGFGDKINFDVHPFSGAIGMKAYDTFKAFSALLMAMHKYGVFVILVLATCQLVQLHRLPDPRAVARWLTGTGQREGQLAHQRKEEEGRPGALKPSGQRGLSYIVSDHMSLTLSLFTACAGLGFYMMFSIAARHHPYEQATCTLLLAAFLGGAHNGLAGLLLWFDRRGHQGSFPQMDFAAPPRRAGGRSARGRRRQKA